MSNNLDYANNKNGRCFHMQEKFEKINVFNVALLFFTSIGLVNHVTIIPALLSASGRDAWIAVLFTMGLLFLWSAAILYVIKGTNKENIYVWLKQHFGKPAAYSFAFLITVYLLSMVIITAKDLIDWTHITYLNRTPPFILYALFLFICWYIGKTSIRTIAIANAILLPIIIVLGFFVSYSNMKMKDYSLLTPILADGFKPVIEGMMFSAAGMAEIFLIILIQHRIKGKIKFRFFVIVLIILAGLTLGPTTGGIATFGAEEMTKQRFPAFQQWRLVNLGRFVEHVDFFSIYQWLSGAFIRISLALYVLGDLFDIPQGKRRELILGGFALLSLIILTFPFSDIEFLYFLTGFYLPASLILIITLSVIFVLLTAIANRKGGT